MTDKSITVAVKEVQDARGRRQALQRLEEVYEEFPLNEISEAVVELSDSCPVCGRVVEGTDVRNITRQRTPRQGYSEPVPLVPHVKCPNDCVSQIPHRDSNIWSLTDGEWLHTNPEAEVKEGAVGFIGDHLDDLHSVHLREDVCQNAFSEEEIEKIRDALEDVGDLIGYDLDSSEVTTDDAPLFSKE